MLSNGKAAKFSAQGNSESFLTLVPQKMLLHTPPKAKDGIEDVQCALIAQGRDNEKCKFINTCAILVACTVK